MTLPRRQPAGLLAMRSLLDVTQLQGRRIDPDAVLAVSGATRLGDLRPGDVEPLPWSPDIAEAVDGSTDHVRRGRVALAAALRRALERRTRLWTAVVEQEQLDQLEHLVGGEEMRVIGPVGPDGEVPVAVSPRALAENWAVRDEAHRTILRENLRGVDGLHLPIRLLATLRGAGVHIRERSTALRILRNPTVLAYAVVLLYSALRALPVTFVPGFHGNIAILWAIDLITAIPYTWGIIAMVAGRTLLSRGLGLLVAVVTFTSPYIYFWTHGKGYPWYVDVVVIGMIVAAVGLEAVRWARDVTVADGLRDGDEDRATDAGRAEPQR